MKRFITLIIATIFVVTIQAQKELDYVLLKNGSIIKGTIESVEENQKVIIRSTNGELYTYPMLDVNRISYGKSPRFPNGKNTNAYTEYSNFEKGFWFATEILGAYSCYFNRSNIAMWELDIIGGYRFNEFVRAGIGIGSRYYFNNEKVRYSNIEWSFPIYINVRGNIIPSESRTLVPYYSFDIGGAMRDGFMVRPTIGVRIGEPRSAFLVGLSYMGQSLKSFKVDKESGYLPNREYTSFVALKIGYEF